MDLGAYMAGTIRNIMATAYLNVLDNPREARFVARMQRTISKAERRRKTHLEKEDVAVPPFLIASIATTCNLQCKGCYARKNGIAGNPGRQNEKPSSLGCRLVFYVEYVPFDETTSHLAFRDEHVAEMEQILELRRERFKEMIFLRRGESFSKTVNYQL